ncbi:hypothetical protein SAMN06297229_2217 [Pseudidiomarina planktonica]|uniref:Phage shock protein B n=1 Tax=Pseudidiomarina planktonica TaxID=1323738 RepID=A0A1Y6FXV2_9GAMM|nr:hypothetical protein [Pseudidiomarina planktonica]RUO63321.1 hypothetical protein CWI77_10750 [Pseudidiomarina planktonica]SMQ80458.1 hypothetical protein SAMN06297229_2217 [Pseudidiomarina planktonica]
MDITAIAIVAIIVWGIVEVFGWNKKTKKEKEDPKLADELARLKERVQVLEEIVTDEKYNLKREFDALKRTG